MTRQARAVGLAQRRVTWVILAAILLTLSIKSGALMPQNLTPNAMIMIAAAVFAVRVMILALMMIGVYQLAAALGENTRTRVLYVLGMLIPLVNLIILFIVNRNAIQLLRSHRIKVGLMGARLSDLPPE